MCEKTVMITARGCLALVCLMAWPGLLRADDWPQWRGPDRDASSAETGLRTSWPAEGPPLVWRARGLGTGYASVAVCAGRVFTLGNIGDDECVVALALADGAPLWRVRNGAAYRNNRGGGPRGTPTVDGDRVFALGANGDLSCLRAADGGTVWHVNLLERFGSDNISWGISESVLVEGDLVVCSPGGDGHCVVALDRATGATVWASEELGDRAGYASAVALTVDGVRQVVHFTGGSAAGIRLADGALLWRYDRASNGTANCATPVVHDRHVFVTSGYGTGCALLRLGGGGGGIDAHEVYFNQVMKNHHGGVVLVDGHVYGYSDQLVCMDLLTGEARWQHAGPGKCSLIHADGHLYCLSERGVMALVEASPRGYVEKGRFTFKQFERFKTGGIREEDEKPTWARPALAHGRLFLRDQDVLNCYDVAASATGTAVGGD